MDRHQSFHVYLNNKFNLKEYPNNKNYSFTNIISPASILSTEYEVGLVNMIFKPRFYIVKKGDEDYSIDFIIDYNDKPEQKKTLKIRYVPQKNISSKNLNQLISNLNKDLLSFFKSEDIQIENKGYIFKLSKFSQYVDFQKIELSKKHYPNYSITWFVNEKIRLLLGIYHWMFIDTPETSLLPLYPKETESLMVYTDIIHPVSFASNSIHLIDFIPLQNVYTKNGTLTIYKKINKSIINEISIVVKNEHGEEAPFDDDVDVTIILHFKPIN